MNIHTASPAFYGLASWLVLRSEPAPGANICRSFRTTHQPSDIEKHSYDGNTKANAL